MSFSATEAAFEGFRVTRQNPLSVLVWAGLWLVGLIVAVMILGPMTMPYASEIEAAQGDVAALSPSAVSALSLGMLAVLPVLLALQAILAPAVYRAVYAPQAKRIGYLQLGKVELRTLAVVAVLGVRLAWASVHDTTTPVRAPGASPGVDLDPAAAPGDGR